jgi:hypothetical protein
MPESTLLDATHVRLLRWLRHYPFQRLEDLVVALLPWCGRTTVYTHLKDLERALFVEALSVPLCSGKVLYHLSPVGLTWYLANTQPEGTMCDVAALHEASTAERATLLRLLPRMPALLTLQTVINGLVRGAADTLTLHGHRAQLVRWNWQRDVTHDFTSRGRQMRWFADGVGAFRLRYPAPEEGIEEYWYHFFLLFTPLTHLPLLRARLARLLCWREAAERWPVYTQMPPILVLATSARQAAWWHEATERVTHELGIASPLGVVASLSDLQARDASPWRCAWKHLGSQRACHLRDLFVPQDSSGFPDLFPQEPLPAPEQAQMAMPLVRMRRFHLARARTPQHTGKGTARTSLPTWRRLCLDLSPRAWEVLWLLQAHPLLSRGDLEAQLHLERTSLAHLLAPLLRVGVLASYQTRVGERFALSEAGLRLLAAATHCQVRYFVHRFEPGSPLASPAHPLMPRGLPGLLKQVEHIAGVYGFFDMLTSLGGVRWWETGAICARFYRQQGQWQGIRPDALAEWMAAHDGPWRFWLEWDRGTMRGAALQRKMGAYARYLTSREWAREHQVPPALLCVVPDVAHERLLTRVAREQLTHCPVRLSLYTTTRQLLMTPGIPAAIWRQVLPVGDATAETPKLLRLFGADPPTLDSQTPHRKELF